MHIKDYYNVIVFQLRRKIVPSAVGANEQKLRWKPACRAVQAKKPNSHIGDVLCCGDGHSPGRFFPRFLHTRTFPPPPVTDFESAAAIAVSAKLGPTVAVRGCFFQLCQATWRKIQELGLVQTYRDNESVRQFCGMIDDLALLPESDVTDGMQVLHGCVPDGEEADKLQMLLAYFNATYVNGGARRVQRPAAAADDDDGGASVPRITLRPLPPLFPVSTWNVHVATLNGDDRTNNQCEAAGQASQEVNSDFAAPGSSCTPSAHVAMDRSLWRTHSVRSRTPCASNNSDSDNDTLFHKLLHFSCT